MDAAAQSAGSDGGLHLRRARPLRPTYALSVAGPGPVWSDQVVAPDNPSVEPTAAIGVASVPFMLVWIVAMVPTALVLVIHMWGTFNRIVGTRLKAD
jgi:hypothetical protein